MQHIGSSICQLRRRGSFQKKAHLPTINVRFGTSFRPEAENSLEWKDYLSLFYVSEDEASVLWPHVCK